jgi:hypothetical protein
VTLKEFRVNVLPTGFRVMLKGSRAGKPLVAFFHADTWHDAIKTATTALDTNYASWWPDKYP